MLLSLFAAVVLVAGQTEYPASCRPQLANVRAWAAFTEAKLHAFRIEFRPETEIRTLEVHITPPRDESEPTYATLGWARPVSEPDRMYLPIDFVCTAAQSLLSSIITHEALHLADPTTRRNSS